MVIKKNSFYQSSILDELELIDWEKDTDSTDQCDRSEKEDSSVEISDSDSCTNTNSLPVKEESDELCKVRTCSKFKEKSCCYIMECICLHLNRGSVKILLTLSFQKELCTQEFQGIFFDCQTSKPSSAPHTELGSVVTGSQGD